MNVEKLLKYCLEKLVDKPEVLVITETKTPEAITYEIKVDAADRARVIGREGKTIKALRALINLTSTGSPYDLVIETIE
jgi:uncharacterized protein